MTTHNHWGIHLSTDEPTTGVYTGNQLAWEFLDADFIDVEYEKFIEENPDADDRELDFTGETLLYGDWRKVDGLYEPDPGGEYALICDSNDNYVQVVHSTVIKYGRMCSPCFPGQVDARLDDPSEPDDIHIQAYYALPTWATRED